MRVCQGRMGHRSKAKRGAAFKKTRFKMSEIGILGFKIDDFAFCGELKPVGRLIVE